MRGLVDQVPTVATQADMKTPTLNPNPGEEIVSLKRNLKQLASEPPKPTNPKPKPFETND